MKTWRGYFVVGALLGLLVGVVGIYIESVPLRLIGAVLPLLGLAIGFIIDRRRRRAADRA